jgi:site-specific recombinase XerD
MNIQDYSYEKVYRMYEDYMLLKNYSIHTIKAYLSNFTAYHQWCAKQKHKDIYNQYTVRSYLVELTRKGKKWQTINNHYSAMRKLFREVLELEWQVKKLPRPRKERHLPEIISKQQVLRLIASCKHLKHKALLVVLYATGMRAGEVSRLKLIDIDSERLQLRVRKGKGAKDRYIQIPKELIEYLRVYYKKYKPQEYLFNGRKKGSPLQVSSMRWPIRQAKKRLNLQHKISPHTLRHCYATHHLELGTDLVFIQQNLGHKHLKTTARYIHLCNNRYQHIHHPIVDILPALKS